MSERILSPEDHASLHGLPWIVLQTRSGQEFDLAKDIRRAGFTPYVPRHMQERPRPGWRNCSILVERPLFGTYAFVLGDDRAAQRFVSCDFNTTQRHVKRLAHQISERVMGSIRQAELRAAQTRSEWAPDLKDFINALEQCVRGVLPTRQFRNLGELQALAS